MRASGAAWIFSQFVVAVGMAGLSAPSELARSAPETAVEQATVILPEVMPATHCRTGAAVLRRYRSRSRTPPAVTAG